ncbi:hypothetical protein KEM52_003930 [Ascosphaera acerosa]|nr:hypothetical protein KEM52_003930 [Ascosphaera acerosa]
MFMIRNVSKYLFGDTAKENLIDIPQGLLYIVRPCSPKGYSELIFKDAAASIRRTGQDHQYQLVIQRVYEEGEAELAAEQEDDHGEEGILAASTSSGGGDGRGSDAARTASGGTGISTPDGLGTSDKDERAFLLDQALRLRCETRADSGERVFAWRDLSGDAGDLYEFVVDASISQEKISTFLLAAVHCQYERKYRKPATAATAQELEEFHFEREDPVSSGWALVMAEMDAVSTGWASVMAEIEAVSSGWASVTAEMDAVSTGWVSVMAEIEAVSSGWALVMAEMDAVSTGWALVIAVSVSDPTGAEVAGAEVSSAEVSAALVAGVVAF